MLESTLFYSSLLICISLGSYYKKIDDIEMKRNYGAGLGLLVTCLVCGPQVYHSVLIVWGNIIIIKCCDKRYLHQVSLAYTWIYLLYLHYNLMPTIYFKWIYQTISLRLVGLAFEVNMDARAKLVKPTDLKPQSLTHLLSKEPSAVNIISYAYFFVGLHRGPYYRWKIYDDHFNMPFGMLGDCRVITEKRLKKAFVCGVVLLLLRMKYTPQIFSDENFYRSHSSDYRYLYCVPLLIMYFLKLQMVMHLCTSVCTETGFGVYPARSMPVPGHGPTSGQSLLKLASRTTDVALQQEYNFSVLESFENEKLLLGAKMHDTIRAWDMPTRYWYWMYIYKNFSKSNREVRSLWSSLAWAVWSGPTLTRMIVSITMWVYVHLEREYSELYDTSGSLEKPWNIGFSIMRMFCLIYLTPCFIETDTMAMLKYYNSIYWVFHIIMFALIVVAIVGHKVKRSSVQV